MWHQAASLLPEGAVRELVELLNEDPSQLSLTKNLAVKLRR